MLLINTFNDIMKSIDMHQDKDNTLSKDALPLQWRVKNGQNKLIVNKPYFDAYKTLR